MRLVGTVLIAVIAIDLTLDQQNVHEHRRGEGGGRVATNVSALFDHPEWMLLPLLSSWSLATLLENRFFCIFLVNQFRLAARAYDDVAFYR